MRVIELKQSCAILGIPADRLHLAPALFVILSSLFRLRFAFLVRTERFSMARSMHGGLRTWPRKYRLSHQSITWEMWVKCSLPICSLHIAQILTFDDGGVSGHCNHIDTALGARYHGLIDDHAGLFVSYINTGTLWPRTIKAKTRYLW